MNCFHHPDRTAVGTCKVCSKGLCSDCAADLGHGLACRGIHEERLAEIEQLISRNMRVQRTARAAKYVTPVFFLFMGVVFVCYGLFFANGWSFIVILGVGFIAYGLYVLVANLRAFAKDDTPQGKSPP